MTHLTYIIFKAYKKYVCTFKNDKFISIKNTKKDSKKKHVKDIKIFLKKKRKKAKKAKERYQ